MDKTFAFGMPWPLEALDERVGRRGGGGVPSNDTLVLTPQPGAVTATWTTEPLDFTLTPVPGGIQVTWTE